MKMFENLKNKIKEETGSDINLIPSIASTNQTKLLGKGRHSRSGSTTSLSSFTIDGNKEEPGLNLSLDIKLADGKVVTPKEFKKLESKEEEWRRKLQKKEEEFATKLKKTEELWRKQLEDKEKELKKVIDKKESEKKAIEEEKNSLKMKNLLLEENAKKAADYQKKVCQYQEDIDQLEGFQTQEMAKIKHLLLVAEQEVAEKDRLLKDNNLQMETLKAELAKLRKFEKEYGSFQESGAKQRARTKKKVVTLSSAGVVALGLIILGIVLLSKQPESSKAVSSASTANNPNGIFLDEILEGSYTPLRFNGTFISDNEVLYKNEMGNVVLYDTSSANTKVLLEGNFPILQTALSYKVSADRKYLMVAHSFQKLYRYSFIAHYDIIDLNTKESFPLTAGEGSRLILSAIWAPTGNGLAFVLHDTHDIYYRPYANGQTLVVTRTGKPGVIYNGIPDWVNEEEVFSSSQAMWFSKDGKKLAFASFNDTFTRVMSIPYYGIPGNLDFQYTRAVNMRYPKPGSPNPVVTLHVAYLVETGTIKLAEMPAPGEVYPEPILTAVTWADEDNLSAVWMNRVQNISYITLCNAYQADCTNILSLEDPKGWMDLYTPPIFSHDGKSMVLILPQNQGVGYGEYRHVCIAEKMSGPEFVVRAITKGLFTVTEIVHFDSVRNLVYYLATEENHPERLHLYEASTGKGQSTPKCLTCDTTTELEGKPCLYNKATFSGGNSSIYALACLGPGVPEVVIRDRNHKKILTWEKNIGLHSKVQEKTLPVVERISVPVPGGFNAQVVLYLPADIDRSGNMKYPLLVNVYGGPDSYQSTEKFNVDWGTYLTTQKNIIYATIDGRGSGLKGNDMLFSIYRRLGTYEIEDQISVTSYLQERYPFIDRKRSAIWGWSYGGYATGMVLVQDKSNVFRCGISVAPVTDWAYYDTIYTERFMGLPRPDDNLVGYANAQLNDKIENLRGKKYFLIHGTLDDNVHFQQSMMLSKALEQSDILFRQQSYPDEEHGLAGVRPHLYHSLENFLDECFETKEQLE